MTEPMIEAYSRVAEAATNQGQREHTEALGMLEAASWFDNFGPEYYSERLIAVHRVVTSLGYVPDGHEQLAEEAEDFLDWSYRFREGE